jgi:hypothetical protein
MTRELSKVLDVVEASGATKIGSPKKAQPLPPTSNVKDQSRYVADDLLPCQS